MHSLLATTIAVLACTLSGCALLIPPVEMRPSTGAVKAESLPEQRLTVISDVVPIELDQLEPGQFCQLQYALTESFPEEVVFDGNGGHEESSARVVVSQSQTVAGRVVSIEESNVVLAEAIRIEERRSESRGVPILRKVPYVSRLFKNTGVGREVVPIDGNLCLQRSTIRQASRIAAEHWPGFRVGEVQRIGLDFDLDAANNISNKNSIQVLSNNEPSTSSAGNAR